MSLRKKYVNSSLINKTCSKCGNSYPRDEEHFYKNKSSSNKSLYDSEIRIVICPSCSKITTSTSMNCPGCGFALFQKKG